MAGLWVVNDIFARSAIPVNALGIFILAIADSSFLTLPEANDLVIVILSAGNSWRNMMSYVAVTIAGSVTGCLMLYMVGRRGGSALLRKRFSGFLVEKAERLYARFGSWSILVPSILPPPCPFKIFVLSAGVFRMNHTRFLLAILAGRAVRYSTWGILAVLYGSPIRLFIQENLDKIGIWLLAFFAVISALLLLRIFRQRRSDPAPGPTGDA